MTLPDATSRRRSEERAADPVLRARGLVRTAVLGLVAVLAGGADEPKPPRPATTTTAAPPPATKPVTPAPGVPTPVPVTAPVASPKAVAIALAGWLEKGDAAAAKALVPADAAHARWIDAAAGLAKALQKLDAASIGRFGEPGKAVSQARLHLADAARALEQAQEKIDGETATLTVPGRARPLAFRRVGGKWIAVVGPTDDAAAARQVALYERLTRAASRMTDEIAAGAYTGADAAGRVFAARVLEARLAE